MLTQCRAQLLEDMFHSTFSLLFLLIAKYQKLFSDTSIPDSLCLFIFECSGARVIIKLSGHQYRWLAGGYDRWL